MKYIIIGVISLFIILFGVLLFTRGGSNSGNSATNKAVKMSEYAEKPGSQVQFTTDGPINSEEAHRAIRISITANSRTFDIIKGYNGDVLSSKSFPNTSQSFSDFLAAIDREGFLAQNKVRGDNYESICPTQYRYTFQLIENTENIQKTWAASCTSGSFNGNRTVVTSLFQAQIPGYLQLTNGVNFSLSN